MKLLIPNADDFGLSAEVNAGVIEAHRIGIITSASLMVAERFAPDAAAAAKDYPALDVGLHAVVCKGKSVLEAARVRGAVNAQGTFIGNPVVAGIRYFFDRSMRAKLGPELRAQVERHFELVGRMNHLDGHLNFHVHPLMADLLVELASEFKVPCIRLPRERVAPNLSLRRDHAPRKMVEAVIFRALARRTSRMMRERGIKSTDWLFGLYQSGHLDEDYVVATLDKVREGTTEIYFHPAKDIGRTPPRAEAQREVSILTSRRVRDTIESRAIELTTFAELAPA